MHRHPLIPVTLVVATPADRARLSGMLDRYLRELSGHRELPVGAIDAASYPYLDAYWSERGRHPFLIRGEGDAVGFAFVRDPRSTDHVRHELAEFFIVPESRRRGIGGQAAATIWRRFPGSWELQVHARNAAAVRFWSSSIAAASIDPPVVHEVRAPDGQRLQFNFCIEPAP